MLNNSDKYILHSTHFHPNHVFPQLLGWHNSMTWTFYVQRSKLNCQLSKAGYFDDLRKTTEELRKMILPDIRKKRPSTRMLQQCWLSTFNFCCPIKVGGRVMNAPPVDFLFRLSSRASSKTFFSSQLESFRTGRCPLCQLRSSVNDIHANAMIFQWNRPVLRVNPPA